MYSAQLGRFLQADPIRLDGGDVNIYRYLGNSVLSLIDPWGLCKVKLVTDMSAGRTTFTDDKGCETIYKSSSQATRNSNPGAEGPYKSDDIKVVPGPYKNQPGPYGNGPVITTDDDRGRWIHGGGTGLDPNAPEQGWLPTYACTRMQNKDIKSLADQINAYRSTDSMGEIPYSREGTAPPRGGNKPQ